MNKFGITLGFEEIGIKSGDQNQSRGKHVNLKSPICLNDALSQIASKGENDAAQRRLKISNIQFYPFRAVVFSSEGKNEMKLAYIFKNGNKKKTKPRACVCAVV